MADWARRVDHLVVRDALPGRERNLDLAVVWHRVAELQGEGNDALEADSWSLRGYRFACLLAVARLLCRVPAENAEEASALSVETSSAVPSAAQLARMKPETVRTLLGFCKPLIWKA